MRLIGSPQPDPIWGDRWWTASKALSCIRILFVFDPWRSAILLIGGDKSGNWKPWYTAAIPEAERLYADYLEERRGEEEQ